MTDPAERIQCLYCGRWFRALAPHLSRVHGVTGEDYRAEHHLRIGYPLIAPATARRMSERRLADMAERPELAPPPSTRAQQIERSALSAPARATTDALPAVHAARSAATSEARIWVAGYEGIRARMDAAAREAGYESLTDAITRTAAMTRIGAARRIGVSRDTVRDWRIRLGLQPGTPRHRPRS